MISMPSRIRRARTLRALSQSEVALRMGVRRSAVTQWESAAGTTPSVTHLAQLAKETGVCFEWLATGRGPVMPDDGALDASVLTHDYAMDDMESQMLLHFRRVKGRRREMLAKVIELLVN